MTMSRMQVEHEVHIPAPEGAAVYVQNVSYADAASETLLESGHYEALHYDAEERPVYYNARIFRRRSEDNGRTWTDEPDWSNETPETLDGEKMWVPNYYLDPNRNVLVSVYTTYEVDTREEMFALINRRQRTARLRYRLSRDGGRTWDEPRWVIDARPGHDAVNFAPGLAYEQNGVSCEFQPFVPLPDGSFTVACTLRGITPPDYGAYACLCLRTRWTNEGDLQWSFGDWVRVSPELTSSGCCEPALVGLGGEGLFMAMRCQGDPGCDLYSTRYSVRSDDGGQTWSAPEPLRYDDGEIVHTPASLSTFFRSTKTGKTYFLANILPAPVHRQTPRYPLAIAEFDTDRCRILRDTVQTIQDLPPGAPTERRYTNWGMYEERGTGDLILTLPEQPKSVDFSAMTRPEDFTADCLWYRVRL